MTRAGTRAPLGGLAETRARPLAISRFHGWNGARAPSRGTRAPSGGARAGPVLSLYPAFPCSSWEGAATVKFEICLLLRVLEELSAYPAFVCSLI